MKPKSAAKRIAFCAAFSALAATPPDWLNLRLCDRMRLTGRGLDGHGESFETHPTADAIAIRYR